MSHRDFDIDKLAHTTKYTQVNERVIRRVSDMISTMFDSFEYEECGRGLIPRHVRFSASKINHVSKFYREYYGRDKTNARLWFNGSQTVVIIDYDMDEYSKVDVEPLTYEYQLSEQEYLILANKIEMIAIKTALSYREKQRIIKEIEEIQSFLDI